MFFKKINIFMIFYGSDAFHSGVESAVELRNHS